MISAIVLAAGESKRFGRSKQLLFLETVLENVRRARVGEIIVVLGAAEDEIRRQVTFASETVVVNPDFAQGMSTSIQAGLRALAPASEAAMLVLADQPFVASGTMNLLIEEFERTRPAALLPRFRGRRGNPAIVARALFAEMMEVRGDTGFRAVFARHPDAVAELAVDDEGVVLDVDRPSDLPTARKLR